MNYVENYIDVAVNYVDEHNMITLTLYNLPQVTLTLCIAEYCAMEIIFT